MRYSEILLCQVFFIHKENIFLCLCQGLMFVLYCFLTRSLLNTVYQVPCIVFCLRMLSFQICMFSLVHWCLQLIVCVVSQHLPNKPELTFLNIWYCFLDMNGDFLFPVLWLSGWRKREDSTEDRQFSFNFPNTKKNHTHTHTHTQVCTYVVNQPLPFFSQSLCCLLPKFPHKVIVFHSPPEVRKMLDLLQSAFLWFLYLDWITEKSKQVQRKGSGGKRKSYSWYIKHLLKIHTV